MLYDNHGAIIMITVSTESRERDTQDKYIRNSNTDAQRHDSQMYMAYNITTIICVHGSDMTMYMF